MNFILTNDLASEIDSCDHERSCTTPVPRPYRQANDILMKSLQMLFRKLYNGTVGRSAPVRDLTTTPATLSMEIVQL
jgi:hypothetical protein